MPKNKATTEEDDATVTEEAVTTEDAPASTGIAGSGEDIYAPPSVPSAHANPNGGDPVTAGEEATAKAAIGNAGATPEDAAGAEIGGEPEPDA